jgi:hypothetical protein
MYPLCEEEEAYRCLYELVELTDQQKEKLTENLKWVQKKHKIDPDPKKRSNSEVIKHFLNVCADTKSYKGKKGRSFCNLVPDFETIRDKVEKVLKDQYPS